MEETIMRRVLLTALLVSLFALVAVPAFAGGNGAINDKDNDCLYPVAPFQAYELRVQKVKTPSEQGQFHCHGKIASLANAPATAMVQLGGVCYLPAYFGWQPGVGHAVITPTGHINLTCNFSP
jgi:hypothetical protein